MDIFVRKAGGTARHVEIDVGMTAEKLYSVLRLADDEELYHEDELLARNSVLLCDTSIAYGDELLRKVTEIGKLRRQMRAVGWKMSRDSLLQAVVSGDLPKVFSLLEVGVAPDNLTLLLATTYKRHTVVERLLDDEYGLDASWKRHHYCQCRRRRGGSSARCTTTSCLKEAVKNTDLPMLQLLLRKGADPNVTDYYQETPLTFLCGMRGEGRMPLILELLKYKAAVNPSVVREGEDMKQRSPLSMAVVRDDVDVVRLLLPLASRDEQSRCFALATHGKQTRVTAFMQRKGYRVGMTLRYWRKYWEKHEKELRAREEEEFESSDAELLEGIGRKEHRRRKLKKLRPGQRRSNAFAEFVDLSQREARLYGMDREAMAAYAVELVKTRLSWMERMREPDFAMCFHLSSASRPVQLGLSYCDALRKTA